MGLWIVIWVTAFNPFPLDISEHWHCSLLPSNYIQVVSQRHYVCFHCSTPAPLKILKAMGIGPPYFL